MSNKYPECATCINRELDPFACEDCEDASNYEPDEDAEDVEDMTYEEFRSLFLRADEVEELSYDEFRALCAEAA